MSDINFVSRRQASLSKTEKQDSLYRRWATIGFGIACALFFVAAGINLFLGRQLTQAAANQRALNQQIADNEPVEVSYLVFTHKLKSLREIYENRSNKQLAIDYFSNLFGEQVFVSGMNYGERGEDNTLTLRLTSENIFAFENTLNVLDSEEVKNVFSTVTKSGVRRDEAGSYNLDLSVELKKEGEQ